MPLLPSPPASPRHAMSSSAQAFFSEDPHSRVRESSPARIARVTIKNRRRRFLELHPDYFSSPERELADPVLYDRLIRRNLTPAEREAEGKKHKGVASLMEAALTHSEARRPSRSELGSTRDTVKVSNRDPTMSRHEARQDQESEDEEADYTLEPAGRSAYRYELELYSDAAEGPMSKQTAARCWHDAIEQRFLRGKDPDFEYDEVDLDPRYDDLDHLERDAEERWFDQEEVVDTANDTGVQDF